jgi:hypothetical protein
MKKSSSNILKFEKPFGGLQQNEKPSGVAFENWGSLLTLIADELVNCIEVLKEQRQEILEVRAKCFPMNGLQADRSDEVLDMLANKLSIFEHKTQYVTHCFDEFRVYHDLANDAIRRRDEEEYPDEFDEE